MVKFPKDIKKIISTLTANRFEGYAVGACVRDSMEGMEPVGWDIATNARLDDIKAMFEDCRVLSEKLGVVRLEFIEEILEGEDVVGEEGICSGCHIAIPPQVFIDLQRGDKIMSCPNCQRLMYWANDFEDLQASGSAAQAEAEESAE